MSPVGVRQKVPGTSAMGVCRDIAQALRSIAQPLLFAILPAVLLVFFIAAAPRLTYAWDFHAFWQAAAHVARGHDPFSAPGVNPAGRAYPDYLYPPVLADLLAPLGLVPFFPAAVGFIIVSALAVPAALWLLGVRDWRCYGVAFLWIPVLHGLRLGTLTPLLLLGIAISWRLSASRLRYAPLALVIVVKLFLWPLVVWDGARAGMRVALRTVTLAVVAVMVSWAAVGFSQLTDYPRILRASQDTWMANGYSLAAVSHSAGIPDSTTTVLLLAGALAASAAIALAMRRGKVDEAEGLALFIGVACLFSPVGWLHYSILLLVPLALLRPTLGLAWFIPLGLWLTPYEEADGSPWRLAIGLAVTTVTIAEVLRLHRLGRVRAARPGLERVGFTGSPT